MHKDIEQSTTLREQFDRQLRMASRVFSEIKVFSGLMCVVKAIGAASHNSKDVSDLVNITMEARASTSSSEASDRPKSQSKRQMSSEETPALEEQQGVRNSAHYLMLMVRMLGFHNSLYFQDAYTCSHGRLLTPCELSPLSSCQHRN